MSQEQPIGGSREPTEGTDAATDPNQGGGKTAGGTARVSETARLHRSPAETTDVGGGTGDWGGMGSGAAGGKTPDMGNSGTGTGQVHGD